MDIAFFVWEYPPRLVGGLGTYATYMTRELVKLGHNVRVFTLNDGNYKTREILSGVEVHRPKILDITPILPDVIAEDIKRWGPGMNFFANIFLYNILSASKIINDLMPKEDVSFDIISAHDWLSIIGGIVTSRETNTPLIFHIHSTEQGRTMGNGSKTVTELERKGIEYAKLIITVSYAMRDELKMLGYPIDKVRVVWNGVDAEKYDPNKVTEDEALEVRKRYGIESDENMLLFIGRLTSVKGADKLIMAMPHILDKHPKTKLVIVGIGEQQDYLVNLAREIRVSDNVIFRFEFITEEERIKHYAASDVAVFPSLYEPFGIVALEAMSMEKPVVVGARGISGMMESVIASGPNQTGYHVNPYDPRDIAWGVNEILYDKSKARWLGKNGRRRVLEEFTWKKAAERTIEVYKEALEN